MLTQLGYEPVDLPVRLFFTIFLGRRFRALKLWFVIRHYGVEGFRYHIRRQVEIAQAFAGWVQASEQFELVVEPQFNLICFRHTGGMRSTRLC